jgi:subtilisin family serine protease
VLLLALLTVFLTTSASAQALGLERKIVVFQRGFPSIPQQAAVISAAGGLPNKPLPLINAYAAALPGPAVKALLHRPEVRRIDDDIEVHALPATDVVIDAKGAGKPPASQPPQSICWGLAHVFYPETYPFATWGVVNGGYGVKVAILDTGIDLTHPDLKANIKGGVNTISPKKSPNDDNGHGTHVAGIVAALDNSIGVVGVAPRAFLYAVKALNSQGTGYLSDIIEGLQWCVANGIQVINMSLGASSDVQSFHDAVTATYEAGIIEVAAAGNSGGQTEYPAAYPEVISVSAVTYDPNWPGDPTHDTITSWSCRGKVDLAAPGNNIYSTYKGGTYATMSGTSMASPYVAGVAALVVAGGTTGPALVKQALQSGALDLGDQGVDPLYGAGLVNAPGAVQ